jgi:hypothetical protein
VRGQAWFFRGRIGTAALTPNGIASLETITTDRGSRSTEHGTTEARIDDKIDAQKKAADKLRRTNTHAERLGTLTPDES